MATFPDNTIGPSIPPTTALPPPIPTPRPDIAPPPAELITSSIGGGRPRATLAQLMARQRAIADRQAGVTGQAAANIPQGLAQLAWTFVNNLEARHAEREEQAGREALTKAITGIDMAAGPTSQQIAEVMGYDPELGMTLYQQAMAARAAAAKTERYGPVITGPEAEKLGLDPAKSYQLNLTTNQYDQVGGGGTNVTVNPPSAETAAKIGLANGFLDNYDAIVKSAQAGEMTGAGYLTSVQFGRGNGGAQYRNLLQGTEALIRILTGAGMSQGEAESRARQFEPVITDDATTLVSKIQGLKQAIENVKGAVENRGKPATETETTTEPAATTEPDTTKPDDAAAAQPDVGDLPSIAKGDTAAWTALPEGTDYTVPGEVDDDGKPLIFTKGGTKK